MNKDIRIKRNGQSVQVFEDSTYIGSMRLWTLCQLVKYAKHPGTRDMMAQLFEKGTSAYYAALAQTKADLQKGVPHE